MLLFSYLLVYLFAEKYINFVAGKELFMIDHSLDDSDVKFLEEGNPAVIPLLLLFVRTVIVVHTESFAVSVMPET